MEITDEMILSLVQHTVTPNQITLISYTDHSQPDTTWDKTISYADYDKIFSALFLIGTPFNSMVDGEIGTTKYRTATCKISIIPTGRWCLEVIIFSFRIFAILLNRHSKPVACWCGKDLELCEELILTLSYTAIRLIFRMKVL